MAETPIEAAAREVRLLLVTSGAINDYDAHYSGQKIVKAFLTACLADPVTVERVVNAMRTGSSICGSDAFWIYHASRAIKALANDQ